MHTRANKPAVREGRVAPRPCTERESPVASAAAFYSQRVNSNKRGAARVHGKRSCCASSPQRASAVARSHVRTRANKPATCARPTSVGARFTVDHVCVRQGRSPFRFLRPLRAPRIRVAFDRLHLRIVCRTDTLLRQDHAPLVHRPSLKVNHPSGHSIHMSRTQPKVRHCSVDKVVQSVAHVPRDYAPLQLTVRHRASFRKPRVTEGIEVSDRVGLANCVVRSSGI